MNGWRARPPARFGCAIHASRACSSRRFATEETPHNLYFLHAWVILPNHVHVILEPRLALPEIMRWLKGRTGRKANQILGRRGRAFWQDESYDHWVRTTKELNELIRYVENNPVQAPT